MSRASYILFKPNPLTEIPVHIFAICKMVINLTGGPRHISHSVKSHTLQLVDVPYWFATVTSISQSISGAFAFVFAFVQYYNQFVFVCTIFYGFKPDICHEV